jgi:putative ABC transport system permease protein
MKPFRALVQRIATLVHKRNAERDFASELESHVQFHILDNLRSGMTPEEARRRALIKLGGFEQTKELYAERKGLPMLETLLQDVRYAVRSLRKNLGFTSVAVLSLVLGIGANTAIFSMVNALLLHPYNFRDLDRLVRVWENRGNDESFDARWIAPADAADFVSGAGVFERMTTYRDHSYNLAKDGGIEPVLGCQVSASFFDVLGVSPLLGRGFAEAEEQPGADQLVILGDSLWRQRFGGDPAVLGSSIRLNGRDYTIIGVMPPKFTFPVPSQLWVPLALTPEQQRDRSQLSVAALARLKADVSVSQATAALGTLSRRLQDEFPQSNVGRTAVALQLRKELYLYTLPLFLLLQAAAVFVLLLACANLANLLYARLARRQKELAMRTALGAGRRRMIQLFLSETIFLSLLAGTLAAAVSLATVGFLRSSISEDWTKWVPGWSEIRVDSAVLAFTFMLSLLVGVAFTVATILRMNRVNLSATLKEGGPGSITRAKARIHSALVVAQVVFALVLLVCAGLMIQGFGRLSNIYAGLGPDNVLRVELSLPEKGYASETSIANFYQQLLHSTASIGGVNAVSLSTNHPASNVDNEMTFFTIEGRPVPKLNEAPSADLQTISADYFSVLRTPLIAGRFFAEADTATVPQVAIVSRSLADRFWPGGNALGERVRLGASHSNSPWITVVGVVADIRQNWWNPPAQPTVYRPFLQTPQRSMTVLLRADADPTNYVSLVREAVRHLDPGVALRGVGTLQTEVTDSIGIIRIMGLLMGLFGAAALALSSMGVYGVLSESVAQRTREFGIRLAMGARSRDVLTLVLGQALRLTLIGTAIAAPVAIALSRLLASLMYGVMALNLAMIGEFAVTLFFVALLAGYVPAKRAMNVDPNVALRYE